MERPTDNQLSTRAFEARQVLDNPVFKEAFEMLRADVVETWKACPLRDTEAQVLALQQMRIVDKFEDLLVRLIEAGKLADHRMNVADLRRDSALRRAMKSF
jgi:hypothetical protein